MPFSRMRVSFRGNEDAQMPKRSLRLAGGGLKIAFQAGVLQVWLDEMGIEFDHADGVSAASFNLAMWAQGMSGSEIAGHWRKLRPIAALCLKCRELHAR